MKYTAIATENPKNIVNVGRRGLKCVFMVKPS